MKKAQIKKLESVIGRIETLQREFSRESQILRECLQEAKSALLEGLKQ